MKPFVCIHGHFYQPPRENPWLEEIEIQDSAHPYHDWNRRITAECYAPNTAARILGPEDRITAIVNNYSRMSFDFGPTLLSWLEHYEPLTYAAILDADRISGERSGGHGSALAQAYNHTILPLSSSRDKRTQVLWGIEDFAHRFRRRPEGMWLPETAVDLESLDLLAEQGIRFTILAPHQALRTRKLGTKAWREVEDAGVDTRLPYLCRLASGRTIALFFYDGPLSREVAFGDVLKHGQRLADGLMQGADHRAGPPPLRHIAVDGETFGHHHRFGDMALSYALSELEDNGKACLINYADFLDRYPPQHEVEIAENTSWSCVHGVERWRADCGCRTGGYPEGTLAWRAPLRAAMDQLRDRLAAVFAEQLRSRTPEPWQLRDGYIEVILDRSDDVRHAFLQKHGLRPQDSAARVASWKLLEMQRAAQLMFTSCGWFFDDIGGIESLQVLRYAARAMQLAREVSGEDPEPGFLSQLERAPCNDPEFTNGRELFEKKVRPAVLDLLDVGIHHGIASLFLDAPTAARSAAYRLSMEAWDLREKEGVKLALGRSRVRSLLTEDARTVSFSCLYQGEHRLLAAARLDLSGKDFHYASEEIRTAFLGQGAPEALEQQSLHLGPARFSLQDLFKDTKRRIVSGLFDATLQEFEDGVRPFTERHAEFIRAARRMNVPLPAALEAVVGFLRQKDVIQMLAGTGPLDLDALRRFTAGIEDLTFPVDEAELSLAVGRRILSMTEALSRDPGDLALLGQIVGFFDAVSGLSLKPDLWQSQNLFFAWTSTALPEILNQARAGDKGARQGLKMARSLGRHLSVEVKD